MYAIIFGVIMPRRPYTPYIPQTIGELTDHVRSMLLSSPTFKDKTGYFPEQNIDTVFFALNEGLLIVRKKLGEERFEALVALSGQMRAHFEADPEDKTAEALKGRELILEIEELLTNQRPKRVVGNTAR